MLPITSAVVFVWGAVEQVTAALGSRSWAPIWASNGGTSLEESLWRLEPLSTPHVRKRLLVPTRVESVTAVFEDALDGASTASTVQFATLGLEAVGVESTPHNLRELGPSWWSGSHGYRKFSEVRLDPDSEAGYEARAIRLITENGRRWELGTRAIPWSAAWEPGARRVVDRFTHQHVVESAAAVGLRPFDEDFYDPSGAVLLEHLRDTYEGERWGTLAMAQGREPRLLRSYLTDPPPPR